MKLQDLRAEPSPALFDAFVALYNRTFTVPSEREDPAEAGWAERLRTEMAPPEPRTHLLVASGDSGEVLGGLVFEFYRKSACGLLTYLVVHPEARGQGISRLLVERAIEILREDARAAGGTLRAAFAEAENPAKMEGKKSSIPPWERLRILSRFARWVDVPYVQPKLQGGSGRDSCLLLLAMRTERDMETLPGPVVRDFLHEFYRALGIADPDNDQDFLKAARCLEETVRLRDLCKTEHPALSLDRTAVTLHFLDRGSAEAAKDASEVMECPIFHSMELDLLSYRFQLNRPFHTMCVTEAPVPVEILFPEHVSYASEGRVVDLACPEPRRGAQALLSRTLFLGSRYTVWHLSLLPGDRETWSEYDLIKLIQLYDGRSERTRLGSSVRFIVGGKEVAVDRLLDAVLEAGKVPLARPSKDPPELPAGTVVALLRDEAGKMLDEILACVERARSAEGQADLRKIDAWLREKTPQGRVLMATGGIVTGILDFDEIDAAEVLDTLEPSVADPQGILRINRATLTYVVTGKYRALEEVWDDVGNSPYLLIPHASLLHNEALVGDAARRADEALAGPLNLGRLENAKAAADRNLNRFLLPNVFNYPTERELFEKGMSSRGSREQEIATRAKLQDLGSRVDAARSRRRENGQLWIAILLYFITMLQIKTVVFEAIETWQGREYPHKEALGWGVILALFVIGTGIRVAMTLRGRKAR